MNIDDQSTALRQQLMQMADPLKAGIAHGFIPEGYTGLGVRNGDVAGLVKDFFVHCPENDPAPILAVSNALLEGACFHEEKLAAFLLAGHVVRHCDASIMDGFRYWLEHYVTNWALCDDLCLKVIYRYLYYHTGDLARIREWPDSESNWCRRAGNVSLVKFIRCRIGPVLYVLDTEMIVGNCRRLLADRDLYVQKSIGWLLKVALSEHPQLIYNFLLENCPKMPAQTIRIATEKLPKVDRMAIMEARKAGVGA